MSVRKGKSERFVVSKHMELATFHKVVEMADGKVDDQQFPVLYSLSAIPNFREK